jgi:hypothetical protein
VAAHNRRIDRRRVPEVIAVDDECCPDATGSREVLSAEC